MEELSRNIQFGPVQVSLPSDNLDVLEDCNALLNDIHALRKEMREKGYLFIRGFHDREEVLAARSAILTYIEKCGEKLSKEHSLEEGVLREGCGVGCVHFMEGHNEISHSNAVLSVMEGKRAMNFFQQYFDTEVVTFDYKWLR
ncbi:hypothetical protein RRG08_063203 [Elysia crispata]|uniref:Uncharacterized protein n=1 Tax=Elysia crispata TaxID=231223 RepID=A0AAE0YUG5_9GAST|nr:hypothetical protein RRG08_063203 [Elysia crispata]